MVFLLLFGDRNLICLCGDIRFVVGVFDLLFFLLVLGYGEWFLGDCGIVIESDCSVIFLVFGFSIGVLWFVGGELKCGSWRDGRFFWEVVEYGMEGG